MQNEEEHLIREMIRIFKEQNQKWEKVNVALTNKGHGGTQSAEIRNASDITVTLSLLCSPAPKMGLASEERNVCGGTRDSAKIDIH